jgi:hypothetical protein
MHKRARNHKISVLWDKGGKELKQYSLNPAIWFGGYYKNDPRYEPQGKKEAKKYIHAPGLLQFVPSTFDDSEISKFLKRAWRNRR